LQDNIAEQSAGFAFAADISYPFEFAIGVFCFVAAVVFLKGPVAIDCTKSVITNVLKFGNLVAVQSGFPVPVASGGVLAAFFGEL